VFSVTNFECASCLSSIFNWAFTALQLIYTTLVAYVSWFASRFQVVFNFIGRFVLRNKLAITRQFIHRHHNRCLHLYSYCYMFRSLKTIIRQNSWDYKNRFYLTSEDLYWCTLMYSFVWIDFPMCVLWVYRVCIVYLQIVKIRRTRISMITNS
jgi:hypothetical protein